MNTRMTALLLSAALIAALGANAATPERTTAAEEPAAAVAEAAVPSEASDTDAARPDEAPEAEAPADADGTLSFYNLRGRMMESYYPLLTLSENIKMLDELDYARMEDDLRDQLNSIANQQWAIMSTPSLDPSSLAGLPPEQQAAAAASAAGASAASAVVSPIVRAQLQAQYDALDKAFDDVRKGKLQADNEGVKRQLRNLQNQAVATAESLYITCKSLAAQDAALTRTIAALERTEREMTLRHDLGQISALTLQQVGTGLVQAKSGQKTLRMNLDNILLQLKAMSGAPLDAALTLGALPQTTAAQLDAMDLEADLARAREASYELYDAKKTYDDAKEDYDDARKKYGEYSKKNEWMQAKHTWQAAQYTYENAKQSYELRFRTLYAQVRDAAQILDAKRAAVTAQEKSYAADALRYEQGRISANALAEAKDTLVKVKDEAAGAERDLFAQYHTYETAVTYGILNS